MTILPVVLCLSVLGGANGVRSSVAVNKENKDQQLSGAEIDASGQTDIAKATQESEATALCSGPCEESIGFLGLGSACDYSDECIGCEKCQSDDADAGMPGTGTGCSAFYRERQTGTQCGMHAVNSVLVNIGKPKTTTRELDDVSALSGEISHGDDYDIGTLVSVFNFNYGMEVTQVGALDGHEQTVHALLKEVGKIDESQLAGLGESQKAAFKRQARSVSLNGPKATQVPWVICNLGAMHWVTYFRKAAIMVKGKNHRRTAQWGWCDLDSIAARDGEAAADMSAGSMGNLKCVAIIVPTKW